MRNKTTYRFVHVYTVRPAFNSGRAQRIEHHILLKNEKVCVLFWPMKPKPLHKIFEFTSCKYNKILRYLSKIFLSISLYSNLTNILNMQLKSLNCAFAIKKKQKCNSWFIFKYFLLTKLWFNMCLWIQNTILTFFSLWTFSQFEVEVFCFLFLSFFHHNLLF